RDVVPKARQLAQCLVVPEARNSTEWEARGPGGLAPGLAESRRRDPATAPGRSYAAFGPAAAAWGSRPVRAQTALAAAAWGFRPGKTQAALAGAGVAGVGLGELLQRGERSGQRGPLLDGERLQPVGEQDRALLPDQFQRRVAGRRDCQRA